MDIEPFSCSRVYIFYAIQIFLFHLTHRGREWKRDIMRGKNVKKRTPWIMNEWVSEWVNQIESIGKKLYNVHKHIASCVHILYVHIHFIFKANTKTTITGKNCEIVET